MNSLNIRSARPADAALILSLIKELAAYEKLSHEVSATEADIQSALFMPQASVECVIAEWEGLPVGFALFFSNFSTFLSKKGLYLEDLYVKPEYRGKKIGKSLLLHLVQIAHERGYGRMEWAVLDWNTPSIDFYKSLGACPMDEWTIFRLNRGQMAHLLSDK
ncbi:GNAT family N-acetyltransferase [Cytophagales bacterium LB-30]|uniref:GNAT family N-acetyltransferase n=1 Tax=Shiella aurantiaca TaxID=3058365 RepID=A0ABT8F1J3_9BACT|nr:GNAT family N-acetyltransferase [Shiella aurantiaca]MDN4164322.1 GNAT family N-acetyltransferase [Shiella aurantiaca]